MFLVERMAFLFIIYRFLVSKGQKPKGDASNGSISCGLSEKNGIQPQTLTFAHFSKNDFTQIFSNDSEKLPRLVTDEIGIIAISKYHPACIAENSTLTARLRQETHKYAYLRIL